MPYSYDFSTVKTQKAKSVIFGCNVLKSIYYNYATLRGYTEGGEGPSSVPFPILIRNKNDLYILDDSFFNFYTVFARPCPLTPRHGFIDSKVVHNKNELSELLSEVLKEDPKGEIILTSFVDKATCNAILTTSGLLSIGPGHDGATAGNNSFSIPVKPEKLNPNVFSHSGLKKNENVFIEAVFCPQVVYKKSFFLTQVRGGPPVKTVKDFIPKSFIIKKVVKPNDNLLAWEKEVKKLPPGTVVYGKGHTLASHAAIHCVINNIPFITSFNPVVGHKLFKVSNSRISLNKNQFMNGITLGFNKHYKMQQMLHVSACVLHNWAYLRNSDQASWLLGLSCSYLVQVLCALSYGEYRHGQNVKYGGLPSSREEVYQKVLDDKKFSDYMKKAPIIATDFTTKGKFNTGYGGKKWAKAVKSSVDIWNTISQIQSMGITNQRSNKLIKQLNAAINLMHNNGWLFNKVSSKDYLNKIANNPGISALELSDFLYQSFSDLKKIKSHKKITKVEFI